MKTFLFFSLLFTPFLSGKDETRQAVRDYWFNGAEINRFELTQSRYGEEHKGHAEFVYVTEPFLTEKQVKHEGGPGASVSVLKLNALRTFNTGIYSYRTMTSTFHPTDLKNHEHALKSVTSIQEWCGVTFQQLNRRGSGWSLQLNSYFQDEGDQKKSISGGYLEDSMWLRMRLDPASLPQGTIRMIPGAVFCRFQHVDVTAHAATAELVAKDGRYHYTIRYPKLGRTLSMVADQDFPHVIREWSEEHADSKSVTRAKLMKRLENQYYWEQNKRSDSGLRRKLGLAPEPK